MASEEPTDDSGEPRFDELLEHFDQCDADHDGVINYTEFVELLKNLRAEMTADEQSLGFREIDSDKDGAIDFEEFNAWWTTD